jgi:hypothetical protein
MKFRGLLMIVLLTAVVAVLLAGVQAIFVAPQRLDDWRVASCMVLSGLAGMIIGAVVGEFVSGNRGLGSLVSIAKANFDVQLMFVGLMWLVILGLAYYAAASVGYRLAARGIR